LRALHTVSGSTVLHLMLPSSLVICSVCGSASGQNVARFSPEENYYVDALLAFQSFETLQSAVSSSCESLCDTRRSEEGFCFVNVRI